MNELELLGRLRADTPEDPDALARARRRLLDHVEQTGGAPARRGWGGTPTGRGRSGAGAQRGQGGTPAQRGQGGTPTGRGWVWPAAGVGGLVAAGVAVAVIVGGTTAPVVTPPPAAVENVLLVAAEQVETSAEGSGRYRVTRVESGSIEEVGPDGDRYRVLQRGEGSTWIAQQPGEENVDTRRYLGTRPLTPEDTAAWERDGSPDSWTVQVGDGPGSLAFPAAAGETSVEVIGTQFSLGQPEHGAGGGEISLQELGALPSDPVRLRAALLERGPVGDHDQWLFTVGTSMLFELPVPAEVRAATYRMLADLPGVTELGAVQDSSGRTGRAVAVVADSTVGPYENRLVIDVGTGTPLAQEIRTVGSDGSMELRSYTLVLETGYTDENPPA